MTTTPQAHRDAIAHHIRCAIAHIRELYDISLSPYALEWEAGCGVVGEMAQQALVDAGVSVGVDLGTRAHQALDVTKVLTKTHSKSASA